MDFRFWVFDENGIIAKFNYYDDALYFIYDLIPDLDSELFGYDILDTYNGDAVEFKYIKEMLQNMFPNKQPVL